MRACLTVIRDSFRESIASRVLGIVLLLITLVLISLAPWGVRGVAYSKLRFWDIRDPEQLAKNLYREFNHPDPSPGKHIWQLLDKTTQQQLQMTGEASAAEVGRAARGVFHLFEELNKLLDRRDFFDATAWQDIAIDDEADQLIADGIEQLPEASLRRLNRLLLEAAYRGVIAESPNTSFQFSYAGLDVLDPLPLSNEQLEFFVQQIMIALMELVVGVGAVFLAILVTSPMIPQMFATGSIELLLSKPITRVQLFLAKYIGACGFVLLSGAYLVVGIWLIAGWRLGMWESRLFLCVPIFLFLFMVYFSVSALAGILWKSPTVCVMVCILFWGVCFSTGLSKKWIDERAIAPNRLVRLTDAGDSLVGVTEHGEVRQWNSDANAWQTVFAPPNRSAAVFFPLGMVRRRLLGPVYNPATDQLIAVELPLRGGDRTAAGAKLLAGHRAEKWLRREMADVPSGTVALLVASDGNCLAVAQAGVFHLSADQLRTRRKEDDGLFFDLPKFKAVWKPDAGKPWRPVTAARRPKSDAIVVLNQNDVMIFQPDAHNNYKLNAENEIFQSPSPAAIAATDDRILVVSKQGDLILTDWQLNDITSSTARAFAPVRAAIASDRGGACAVVGGNGYLQIISPDAADAEKASVSGQGNITAATFGREDSLLVVDRAQRVTYYDSPTMSVDRQIAPPLGNVEWIYRYVVLPLYRVLPKQGELDETISYLLMDGERSDDEEFDTDQPREHMQPWPPVISSAVFTLVVLSICCLLMHRAEF